MSDQLRGMLTVLRRRDTDWSSFTRERIRTFNSLPIGLGIAPAISGPVKLLEEARSSDHDEPAFTEEVVAPLSTIRSERCLLRRSFRTLGSASHRPLVDPIPVTLCSDSEEDMPTRGRESVRASPSRPAPRTSKRRKIGRNDNSPMRQANADPRSLDEGTASEEAYTKVAEANAKV